MSNMDSGKAETFAKELTICAIQNGLIPQYSEAKDSAQAVLDFFNAIRDGVKTTDN